jgi:hypothetical protein
LSTDTENKLPLESVNKDRINPVPLPEEAVKLKACELGVNPDTGVVGLADPTTLAVT